MGQRPLGRRPAASGWAWRLLDWEPPGWEPLDWEPPGWKPLGWEPLTWKPLTWKPLTWKPLTWKRWAWNKPFNHRALHPGGRFGVQASHHDPGGRQAPRRGMAQQSKLPSATLHAII
jgi:hypothetical protein